MGSASVKMADTSESASASEDLPVIVNFSGEWSMDAGKSDSLEALFAAMDAGWLARKIAGKLKITTHFYHTNESVIITDHSFFGNFTLSLVPDGKWRPVLQLDGKSAPMRCMFNHSNGELRIETRFSKGTLLDRRRLLSRTSFEQIMRFAPSGDGAPGGAGADVSARRSFNRVETDDERHAAEAAEESARLMLAHQAAALSLLSGGSAGGLVPSSWKNAPAPAVGGAGAAAVPTPKAATSAPAVAADAKSESAAAAPPVTHAAPASAALGADPFPSDRVPTADFSGSWLLDRTRSDTLDAMLTLMGVPWIARKIANSIEITAVMRHDVLAATAVAEDHSSMGITSNEYAFDGKPKNVTSKEGKTSVVTASLIPVPWPIVEGPQPRSATALAENPTVGASGCIRISTVLPDGAGETIDTRCVVEGGRTLRQLMVYKKGDKTATLMRFLRNDKFDAAKYEESIARMRQHYEAKAAAAAAPAVGGAGAESASPAAAAGSAGASAGLTEAHSSAVAAPVPEASAAPVAAETTATVTAAAPSGDGKSAPALDPCFVSVGGYWTVDATRSETLDSLWKSLGVGWFARVLVGAVDIVHHIAHTKGTFRTEDKSALGTATVALSLDGRWHPVKQLDGRYMLVQARQTLGGGDLGPLWLGDLGWIPRAWLRASQLAAAGKLPASIVVPPLGEDGEHDGDEQLDDEYEDEAFSDSDGEDAEDSGYRPPPPAAASSGNSARKESATSSADLPPLPGSRRRLGSAGGAAAADADDGTSSRDSFDDDDGPESTLAPEARGRHTILRRFPVRVAPFATAEIEVVTVLSDVTAQREALERQSESAATGAAAASAPAVPIHSGDGFAGDVQPPAGAQRLVVTYSMSRRDEMVVTHTHLSADGAVLHAVRRLLVRREAAEQRAVADVADSARIQHACSLIIARRSAADDMKLAYLRRVLARRARRQTRRAAEEEARRRAAASLAQRDSGSAAAGGAGSAARSTSSVRATAAGAAKPTLATAILADEDDESLADGVQCAIM